MFTVSETYEIITPESAEEGDFAESGFAFEKEEWTGSQVLSWLESAMETSSTWATVYGEMDTSGNVENRSLHIEGAPPTSTVDELREWVRAQYDECSKCGHSDLDEVGDHESIVSSCGQFAGGRCEAVLCGTCFDEENAAEPCHMEAF